MAEQTTSVGYVGYSGTGYTFCSEVIVNSQSITDNQSNITVNFKVMPTGNSAGYYLYGNSSATMAISSNNGFSQSVNITGQKTVNTKNQYTVVGTWSGDVAHKTDGTLNITVDVTYGWSSGDAWLPKRTTTSFTTALTTIARASTITASNSYTIANTTSSLSYTITSAAAFYHRLVWSLNGQSTTVDVGLINATSKSGTITNTALLAKIPSATSGNLTLTVTTYSDSGYTNQIGSAQSKGVTLTVGDAIKPSATIGSITLNSGGFNSYALAGKSTVKVASWSVSLVGSATLSSVAISGSNVTPTSSTSSATSGSITSNTLKSSASDYNITFTITATDSRGRTASATTSAFTVKGYSAPTASITAYRYSTSTAQQDDAGTNLYLGYSSAVGSSFSGANTLSTQVWKLTVNGTDTNITNNPRTNLTLSEDYSATVTLSVKDTIGTTTTVTATIAAAVFAIDMVDNGRGKVGVGLGGIAESGYNKNYLALKGYDTQFYQCTSGTGTSTSTYIKLCSISIKSHLQGRFIAFRIFVGQGNNGATNQTAYIDLLLQSGWTGSLDGRLGGYWILEPMATTYTPSSFNIVLIATNGNLEYDLWINPINTYCVPSYGYWCDSPNVVITHIGDVTQTTAPTGTTCSLAGSLTKEAETATSATNATNTTNVNLTRAAPSTSTSYAFPLSAAVTGNQPLKVLGSLALTSMPIRFVFVDGTTSANGSGLLVLGNGTASGTAGNVEGMLRFYSSSSGYVNLRTTAGMTGSKNIYLPTSTSVTLLANDTTNHVSLFSGTISSSATSTTFTGAGYSAYCIVGAEARGYRSSIVVPRSLITTTAQQWMVTFYGASSIENVRFTLQASAATGGTITLTWQSGKTVTQVFGIK